MFFLKWILLIISFAISVLIGLLIANKYKGRVKDLKSIRSILNILDTKIKYTYEPLPQIFEDISKSYKGEIRKNFFRTICR